MAINANLHSLLLSFIEILDDVIHNKLISVLTPNLSANTSVVINAISVSQLIGGEIQF